MSQSTGAATDPQRQAWRARIRAAGMRVTAQREAVLLAVQAQPHATAESIAVAVDHDDSPISLSTVYRALEALESIGLIRHTHVGQGAPVYHVAQESAHIHLRCDGCGAVESVPIGLADGFVGAVAGLIGFRADVAHAAVHGRCAPCLARE